MKENPVHASSAQPKGNIKNVGIWIRVSTEDQAQGESPQHHEHRARAYAEWNKWNVCEVYDLAGVSGKSVMEHPEAKRMLADINRGHITGLIFSKLARLARNTRELLDFSDVFRAQNADLISLQEKIDTTTPSGRLFYTMIAAMAQWEREEIADRVKASVGVRAKLGKPLNGTSPYGYHWKNKQLVPHPEQAPIRKLAYELFLEHRRKGVVARTLNDRGYRTSTNAKWSDVAVGRILVDPTAKGVRIYNSTRKVGVWDSEARPEAEWITVPVEPIIEETLWNQVNQILEEQSKIAKRPGKKPAHLFAGLAVCHCGHKMYVPSNMPKYVCLECRNKIPITDLEGIIGVHQQTIQRIRAEMTQTHRLYVDGHITAQGFSSFYKPAEEQLNQLTAELPRLQGEVDVMKVNQISGEDVLTEADTLYNRWPGLAIDDRRKIAETLCEKITIGEGKIRITFTGAPSSGELCNNLTRL